MARRQNITPCPKIGREKEKLEIETDRETKRDKAACMPHELVQRESCTAVIQH